MPSSRGQESKTHDNAKLSANSDIPQLKMLNISNHSAQARDNYPCFTTTPPSVNSLTAVSMGRRQLREGHLHTINFDQMQGHKELTVQTEASQLFYNPNYEVVDTRSPSPVKMKTGNASSQRRKKDDDNDLIYKPNYDFVDKRVRSPDFNHHRAHQQEYARMSDASRDPVFTSIDKNYPVASLHGEPKSRTDQMDAARRSQLPKFVDKFYNVRRKFTDPTQEIPSFKNYRGHETEKLPPSLLLDTHYPSEKVDLIKRKSTPAVIGRASRQKEYDESMKPYIAPLNNLDYDLNFEVLEMSVVSPDFTRYSQRKPLHAKQHLTGSLSYDPSYKLVEKNISPVKLTRPEGKKTRSDEFIECIYRSGGKPVDQVYDLKTGTIANEVGLKSRWVSAKKDTYINPKSEKKFRRSYVPDPSPANDLLYTTDPNARGRSLSRLGATSVAHGTALDVKDASVAEYAAWAARETTRVRKLNSELSKPFSPPEFITVGLKPNKNEARRRELEKEVRELFEKKDMGGVVISEESKPKQKQIWEEEDDKDEMDEQTNLLDLSDIVEKALKETSSRRQAG